MEFVTIREMKTHLSEFVAKTKKAEIVITKNGKPAALLSYLNEEDFDDYLLEHNPKFMKTIENRWKKYLGRPHEKTG